MNDVMPLTDLIHRAQAGDQTALGAVFDAAYQDLRALARQRLGRGGRGGRGTLPGTTSLVHESFLRFAQAGNLRLQDRQHFLRYAAHVMRSVVVDLVRQSASERRGGAAHRVTLATDAGADPGSEEEILRVHDALEALAEVDERLVQVVEMRYFAGMTHAEVAEVLGVTERTVRRDWEKARVLLAEALC